jgi:hypothetical protein
MEKMRDLEKQAPTPEQKPQVDWRKKALYNLHKSEAAQERTSSSSDRDLEQGAMAFTDRRLKLRERHWLAHRNDGGVAAASTENRTHRYRIQESKAESRHNDANSNTRQLGRRKGLWNSAQIDSFAQWHKGELSAPMLDLQQCYQDQYIQNNYHKDETEEQ